MIGTARDPRTNGEVGQQILAEQPLGTVRTLSNNEAGEHATAARLLLTRPFPNDEDAARSGRCHIGTVLHAGAALVDDRCRAVRLNRYLKRRGHRRRGQESDHGQPTPG